MNFELIVFIVLNLLFSSFCLVEKEADGILTPHSHKLLTCVISSGVNEFSALISILTALTLTARAGDVRIE